MSFPHTAAAHTALSGFMTFPEFREAGDKNRNAWSALYTRMTDTAHAADTAENLLRELHEACTLVEASALLSGSLGNPDHQKHAKRWEEAKAKLALHLLEPRRG